MNSEQPFCFYGENGEAYADRKVYALGDIVNLYQPETIKKGSLVDGAYPVYGANGIIGRTDRVNHKTAEVVVGCRGNVGVVHLTQPNAWINGNAMVVQPKTTDIEKAWLFWALTHLDFDRYATGSAQPQLIRSVMERIPLSVPSAPEQKKIAEFLGLLDDQVENQRERVRLLEEQKRGYVQRLFSRELRFQDDNGNEYPEWEERTLEEMADWLNGWAFKPADLEEEGLPVIKIKELLNQEEPVKVRTKKTVPEQYQIHQGDLIFSWSMTLASRLWKQSEVGLLNQHLYKVTPAEGFDTRFLNHLLQVHTPNLYRLAHGVAAQHITRKNLLSYSAFVPSLAEQKRIASFLSSLDEQSDIARERLTLLDEQKRGYLQALLLTK